VDLCRHHRSVCVYAESAVIIRSVHAENAVIIRVCVSAA
jgi:hypothetical protein